MTEPVFLDSDALHVLLTRVEMATAETADEIEPDLLRTFGLDPTTITTSQPHPPARPMLTYRSRPRPLTVTDDALALVDRVIPEGEKWSLSGMSGGIPFGEVGGCGSTGPTPPLALCAALLRFLIKRGEE